MLSVKVANCGWERQFRSDGAILFVGEGVCQKLEWLKSTRVRKRLIYWFRVERPVKCHFKGFWCSCKVKQHLCMQLETIIKAIEVGAKQVLDGCPVCCFGRMAVGPAFLQILRLMFWHWFCYHNWQGQLHLRDKMALGFVKIETRGHQFNFDLSKFRSGMPAYHTNQPTMVFESNN